MTLAAIIKNKKGFSVIELIVVLSIFAIISSVSTFNYNQYQSRINRMNIAQDIALTIRQAQVYGLSASGGDIGDTSFDTPEDAEIFFGTTMTDIITDRSVRGVNFNPETKTMILFEDIDRNRIYTASDRIIDERTVISGDVFMQICIYESVAEIDSCLLEVGDGEDVNITFQRPYPDAVVEWNSFFRSAAIIHIIEDSGSSTSIAVQIDPAGQITVHNI